MEQKYKKDLNLLSEFLDFMKYKVEKGRLTVSEMEGLVKMFRENVSLTGTAEDIAGFYHRTPQDVRNIVHRKMFSKPTRKVHYSFVEFQEVAPEGWKK